MYDKIIVNKVLFLIFIIRFVMWSFEEYNNNKSFLLWWIKEIFLKKNVNSCMIVNWKIVVIMVGK